MRPNGVEKQVWPVPQQTVQTFDFQNDGALNWTGVSGQRGTPTYVTGQGWTIGSSSGNYQSSINPPSSIYNNGILKKIKIWMYKPNSSTSFNTFACGPSTITPGFMIAWYFYNSNGIHANDNGSWYYWNTSDATGEIIIEYLLKDNGDIDVIINGTSYTTGNFASRLKDGWNAQSLEITIGRWGYNANCYLRKLEITTEA